MSAKRSIFPKIVDALRAWPDGPAATVRSLAKVLNLPHIDVGSAIQSMRYAGMIEWDRLALSASMAAANDQKNEQLPVAEISGDDGAAGEAVSAVRPSPAAEVDAETAPAPLHEFPVAKVGGQAAPEPTTVRAGDSDGAAGGAATPSPAADAPKDVLGVMPSARVRVVYETIRAIAAEGGPCPKNRELAVAAGCMESAVPTVLLWLRGNGWLVLEQGRAKKERRFFIPETGQRTGWPAPDEKLGEAKAAPSGALEAKAAEAAEIAARRDAVEQERAEQLRAATRAEAEAAGRARRIAGTVGGGMAAGSRLSVPARPRDSYGAAFQAAFMNDGPGSAAGVLRAAWPEDLRLLERIAQAHGERPVPMLVRLIRAEAQRMDLRRRDALPDGGAWWVTGTAKMVDDEFDGEFDGGIPIHG